MTLDTRSLSNRDALKYIFEENPASDQVIAQAKGREVFYTSDRQGHHVPGEIELTFRSNDAAKLDVTSPVDDWIKALPSVISKGFESGTAAATPAKLVKLEGDASSNAVLEGQAGRPVQFYERTVLIKFEA